MSERGKRELAAIDFITLLEHLATFQQKYFPATDIQVVGRVELSPTTFPNGLRLDRVEFLGSVLFDNVVFGSDLVLEGCSFQKGLMLAGATIRGDLRLEPWEFPFKSSEGESDLRRDVFIATLPDDGTALNLDFAKIEGDLKLDRVGCEGGLSVRCAVVQGDLRIEAGRYNRDGTASKPSGIVSEIAPAANLDFTKVDGNLVISQHKDKRKEGQEKADEEKVLCQGRISARGLELEGDLRVNGLRVEAAAGDSESPLNLDTAKIHGSVRIQDLTCKAAQHHTSLSMNHCRVRGGVHLKDSELAGGVSQRALKTGDLSISDTIVGGDLQMTLARVRGALSLASCTVGRDLVLSGGSFAFTIIHSSWVKGALVMIEGRSGQLRVGDDSKHVPQGISESGRDAEIRPARLGALILKNWQLDGYATFDLDAVGFRKLPDGSWPSSYDVDGIYLESVTVAEGLSFVRGIGLRRAVDTHEFSEPSRLRIGRPGPRRGPGDGKQADSGQGHSPGPGVAKVARLADPWLEGLCCDGPLVIRNCTIGGDLDLTGIQLRGTSAGAEPRGSDHRRRPRSIVLDYTTARSIRFASPFTEVGTPDTPEPALWKISREIHCAAAQASPGTYRQLRLAGKLGARCEGLSLERTSAGEIDLSGVTVIRGGNDSLVDGGVNGKRAVVKGPLRVSLRMEMSLSGSGPKPGGTGQISFATSAAQSPWSEWRNALERQLTQELGSDRAAGDRRALVLWTAIIQGGLDLRNAAVGELEVCGDSFDAVAEVGSGSPASAASASHTGRSAPRVRMKLDDAEVGRFSLRRGGRLKQDESPRGRHKKRSQGGQGCQPEPRNGFPAPVSLRDLRVSTWALAPGPSRGGPSSNPQGLESHRADDFLDLLDNDEDYHETTYSLVERYLEQRGHEEEARRIYIASRFRRARVGRDGKGRDQGAWCPGQGRLERLPAGLLSKVGVVARALFRPIYGGRLERSWQEELIARAALAGGALLLVVALGLVSLLAESGILGSPANVGGLEIPATGVQLATSLAILLALGFLLAGARFASRGWAYRVVDRLYWSLLDYGTSAARLAKVIVVLFALSFLAVAQDRDNFEPSLALRAAHPELCRQGVGCEPPDEWTWGSRVWTTMQAHVPLVALYWQYDWRPTDRPASIAGVGPPDRSSRGGLWRLWPTARNWFGCMTLVNYVLWPLFLPFIFRKLIRGRPGAYLPRSGSSAT